jgi:hypothetical protein
LNASTASNMTPYSSPSCADCALLEVDHVDPNYRSRNGVADHEGRAVPSGLFVVRSLLRAATRCRAGSVESRAVSSGIFVIGPLLRVTASTLTGIEGPALAGLRGSVLKLYTRHTHL